MITRRDFLTAGALGAASRTSLLAGQQRRSPDSSAPGCGLTMANPLWTHLSSAHGDLPVPELSDNQDSCMVGDIDGDGRVDFAFTGRTGTRKALSNAAIWMRNTGHVGAPYGGWEQYVIEPDHLQLEAGGALFDVDGDGHFDLVNGGDATSNEVWWWENPYPNYDPKVPWKRHIIKDSGKTQQHDLMFGDVLGEGKPQLVFWNQGAHALFLARIPDHPRTLRSSWELHVIFQGDAPMEGLAMADIDGDGVIEIAGGGRWFKHDSGLKFIPHIIDDQQKFSRAAAGKLIKSASGPQVVFDSGDGCGRLKWYERRADDTWVSHDLLGEDEVHGHTLRIADVDGDGNMDIFCAEMAKWCDWTRTVDYPRASLWAFYGDGHGNFEKITIAYGGHGTHEARLADLNGDGKLDIVGKPYMAGASGVDIWLNPGSR